MPAPEVSYIVLSYNYERYIGQAIGSVLRQTHQDFEIVVVDDASTDRSCDVVESFGDPRIRLIRNQGNMGGTEAYNKAVGEARGTWLSNLDADDWIAPNKTRTQLQFAHGRTDIAVVGSFVRFMNAQGAPLPHAKPHEAEVNVVRDLNRLEHWIGRNCLCRSSTLVRREAHLAIGLDDVTMMRAPDYELWTRFLSMGHGIVVVPEQLTYYRLHSQGVTYGDPAGTFLEMCWTLLRNVVPTARARGAGRTEGDVCRWIVTNSQRFDLGELVCERILGLLVEEDRPAIYSMFQTIVSQPNPRLEDAGRQLLSKTRSQLSKDGRLFRNMPLLRGKPIERLYGWLRRQVHSRSS